MIQPTEDRVVIKPDDSDATTRSGLHIPSTAQQKPTNGKITAVGPGEWKDGKRVPLTLSVGDRVIFSKYAGTTYVHEGEELVIMKAVDILAVLPR